MIVGATKASLLNWRSVSGIVIVFTVATVMLIAKPFSDAWAFRQRAQSPSWRRVVTTVTSQRASAAFYRARESMAEAVAARTNVARQSARKAVVTAQKDFSRDMAKAADASATRRPEILALKIRGEAIIGHDCAQWVASDQRLDSMQTPPRSRLLYFEKCTAALSSFQQVIDNQTALLVQDMMKAYVENSKAVQ